MSDGDAASAVRTALATGQGDVIDQILEPCDLTTLPVDLLNSLLVSVIHHQHQRVARALQLARDPSTVPYAATALRLGFSHLVYTASDDDVIAKWYSWLLADIGTPEAIAVLRQYVSSDNEQVAAAMTYRLSRLDGDGEN
jgi:hypothetical protein